MTPRDAAALLDGLTAIASRAADAIRARPAATVAHTLKADQSPVSAADEAAEAVILDGLMRLVPDIPVVSEEAYQRAAPAHLPSTFLLVDPLDGTREFLAGRDEFAVNIGLVHDGLPIAGVIAAPARHLIWRGAAERAERVTDHGDGRIGDVTAIRTRPWPAQGAVATVSRSHLDPQTEAYLARLPVTRAASGSALKFCAIAQGNADVYPRFGPTCEWDIAAGHAILVAAGGAMTDASGRPLRYGQLATRLRVPGFLAWGDPSRAAG
jgi:3'(2'), 5'-bisphosphate nucleotidase